MRLAVDFEWTALGWVGAPEGRLLMPAVPAEPGVYRFLVQTARGIEVYIGESQDLHRRMLHNYAYNHQGTTNVRVRGLLLERIADRRSVELAMVTGATLEWDGVVTRADMAAKHVRLLIESAAIEAAHRAGHRVHNL